MEYIAVNFYVQTTCEQTHLLFIFVLISDDIENTEYSNLFSSDLGVAVITESIQQMAEMR